MAREYEVDDQRGRKRPVDATDSEQEAEPSDSEIEEQLCAHAAEALNHFTRSYHIHASLMGPPDRRVKQLTKVTIQGSRETATLMKRNEILPRVPPIPTATMWTALTKNYEVEDEPQLKFLPYFGDDDEEDVVSEFYQIKQQRTSACEVDFTKEMCEAVLKTLQSTWDLTPSDLKRVANAIQVEEEVLVEMSPSVNGFSKSRAISATFGWNKQARIMIESCSHDGPCELGVCSCMEDGIFCSKNCHCVHDECKIFFQGCQCQRGRCQIHSCENGEAYGDNRRSKTADEENKDEKYQISCQNRSIALGKQKHVRIGRSNLSAAGWGLFVNEFVAKDEFIIEYIGEMVSQEEADRRGAVYDKVDRSYLFNLDTKTVIDSTRKGNKTRFINHSKNPNCACKIMNVSSDFRIGLYAIRDIEPHTELFFDYGYDKELYHAELLKQPTVTEWM
ncbi:hypothetical protein BBO99_00004906 [Phytophthora kernoviae]|uniref:SET domain-containing protein n=2 Tax=Phytophthora kernoviae TaxID=325452 RepID=A0A3R7HWT4_9STRA|nr:hypothetical protein G195_009538 [Phytophthora kernoviae 00238/432]KAG2524395.1 hypothetical protein JM16_004991 [Phytophthora kernoviae]KAG2526111.1 hypothetical protein JM18_004230 [Phytophthora kernoviae]RLN02819.1 hypothetical protein BBI17_005008 [Phytophthora kernoviae]RLN79920.1 hypothetical protein BBO99_00004906 [Phytophthora kernoviae]